MVSWPVAVSVASSTTAPVVVPVMAGASSVPVIVIVTVFAADAALAVPLSSEAMTSKRSVSVCPSRRKSRSWTVR